MHLVVAGASGLIGSALVTRLRARGDSVVRLVRHAATAPDERSWDPDAGNVDLDVLEEADVVVNLGGVGVGDRRWTAARKSAILESRLRGTSLLARSLATIADRPRALVQASAVGWYGDRGDTVLDEAAPPGEGFLAEVVVAWEAATAAAERAGVRVALARTGIVLSPSGGAVGRLVPLARLGLAGRLGPGTQFWPWITLADEVRALEHLVDHKLAGPVNLVAPHPVTNAELVRQLARALGRPAPLAVPAWALRLGLGEFANELLASQLVVPRALEASGFEFEHTEIRPAVEAVLNRRGDPPTP